MALNGTVNTTAYDGRYYELSWTATQSIADNKSTIHWTLSAKGKAGQWYAERTLKVVLAGSTVFSKTERVARYDGVIDTGSVTVSHNNQGEKSFSISIEGAVYTSSVNVEGSGNFTLDTIPRYANFTKHTLSNITENSVTVTWDADAHCDALEYSINGGERVSLLGLSFTIDNLSANTDYKIKLFIRRKDSQLWTASSELPFTTYDYPHCIESPNFILGEAVTLKFYNPLKRTFKFYIIGNGTQINEDYDCSGETYKGITNTTTSVPYLYATIPNAKSGKYKVKVVYDNSTKTRDNGNTYTIKESACYPTFSNFTYKDINTAVTNVTGNNQILVKGLSKLAVEISTANKMVAVNGANPKNYIATIDTLSVPFNYSTSAISKEIGVVNTAGTKRLSVTAYDTRTLPKTAYKDVTVYDYDKPKINVSIKRLNNFEAQTTLSVNGSYSRLIIGSTDKNTISKVEYRYREVGGTWSSPIALNTTISSGKFICNDVILTLDNTKAFEFEIIATDKLSTHTEKADVDKGQAIFFISTNKRKCFINDLEISTREDYTANGDTQEINVYERGRVMHKRYLNGRLSSDTNVTNIQLPENAVLRNMYGHIYYTNLSLFVPLNYANPDASIFTYYSVDKRQIVINITNNVFRGCEYVIYAEYTIG